jgi:hypothetical protein
MAPGFGSGLAHALTQGLTGYAQGEDEQRKQLIILAAQRRAEERQKQQDEMARIGALTNAAQAGLQIDSPSPVPVQDTASMRAVKSQNPVSPEGGAANQQPAEPSQDGTVVGQVGKHTLRIPQGGLQGKAARDQAQKDTQKIAERYNQLSQLNETVEPKYRRNPAQLRVIAANDVLYNKHVEQATGLATDPLEMHKQERLFDVAHPTRDVSGDNTSWQTVTTADGSMVQVNPKTGATRPIGIKGRTPTAPGAAGSAPTTAMRNKAAEAAQTISTIDEAVGLLNKHPAAVGPLRGRSDVIDQWVDEDGVAARAALASVSSQLLHALSGAAVSPSEYARLRQYVPVSSDRYKAAVVKLDRLKAEMQRLHASYQGAAPASAGAPGGTDVSHLIAKYGLEP